MAWAGDHGGEGQQGGAATSGGPGGSITEERRAPGIPAIVRLLRRFPRLGGLGLGIETAEIMAARTAELRLLARVPKAFTVRTAEPADAPALDRFLGDSTKRQRRSSSGDACILALGDGEIHATEWVRWGPAQYEEDARRLGVIFSVPPRSCWLHNGKNGSSEVVGPWGMVMGRLRVVLEFRGVDTAFLQVDAHDAYSVACHESLGFRRLGRLLAIRLPGVHFVGFRLEGGEWSSVGEKEFDLSRLRV